MPVSALCLCVCMRACVCRRVHPCLHTPGLGRPLAQLIVTPDPPPTPPHPHARHYCRLRTMQSRPASHDISQDESRQLQFDLDSMYAAFNGMLKQAR